jgi:hypothetical protein
MAWPPRTHRYLATKNSANATSENSENSDISEFSLSRIPCRARPVRPSTRRRIYLTHNILHHQ